MQAREVVERAQSEVLVSGGIQIPAWDTLFADIDATVKTFALKGNRSVTVPPDAVLEFDDDSGELALNSITSGTSVEVHERGWLESTAASHLAGTRVIVNNPYNKLLLLNHLKTVVAMLYGLGVYRAKTDTTKTYDAQTPISLDADAKDTYAYMWVNRNLAGTLGYNELRKGQEFQVLYDFSPIKVQFFGGGQKGFPLTIPYKADFGAVTALTSDLDILGIPLSLQHHLAVGVASRALAGKEAPNVQAEHIRRALANQNIPVGSRLSISEALWRKFLDGVVLEKTRLMTANPPSFTYSLVR